MTYPILNYKNAAWIIIFWEILVLLISAGMQDEKISVYHFAARFSARTSFVILASMLLWSAIEKLQVIWVNNHKKTLFKFLIAMFTINHIIHLVYLSVNQHAAGAMLFQPENIPGAMVYAIVVALPFYAAWVKTGLRKLTHLLIALLLVAVVFAITYLERLYSNSEGLSSKAWYLFFLVTILTLIIINIYRLVKVHRNASKV